ncbi:MAG: ABC transporter substrate-binding protein [Pseudomonadota bacterium]
MVQVRSPFRRIETVAWQAACLVALGLTLGAAATAIAEPIEVTDIAGRKVSVEKDVQRVILGEGRMMYSVAVLDREEPFKRIVGWKDDLIQYDPDAFRKFSDAFPGEADKITNYGSPYSGEFSVESAITQEADLVILDYGNYFSAEESGILERLDKAGIPAVFIDFRERPLQNTVPSLMLLGKVFNREDRAAEFVDYYMQQMRIVTNRVKDIPLEERPLVFIENAAGWFEEGDCCNTFGGANFGKMVDEAGGMNWGSRKFPGFRGEASFEAIISDDPDVIIGTGANWAEARPSVRAVLLGYEAEPKAVQTRLTALADRKGFSTMRAVETKRFYSIYHQFYNSPYHFVALQTFAKWFHPDLFEDVDPIASFEELHDRFLPIDFSGVFWASLE